MTGSITAMPAGNAAPDAPGHRPERARLRDEWARQQAGRPGAVVQSASADASFRSYWRLTDGADSWIIMDAPPDKEDCRPFLDVAERLRRKGLHAPRVHAADLERGFLLLEDLGDTLYADLLTPETADRLYGKAGDALVRMLKVDCDGLPDYDAARLTQEMSLFPEWFLGRQLQRRADAEFTAWWDPLVERLVDNAVTQPQCFVHRDYHCGNLMQCDDPPGVLDFQDAVRGPVTYDLVSLLYDRYVSWPRERVLGWLEQFRVAAAADCGEETWVRWADLMALQRSLKVVGIFARLNIRDNKPRYLEWQPRFAGYVADLSGRYPELAPLHEFMVEVGLPALDGQTP